MNRHTHVPVRMCMGCGGRDPQLHLLRLSTGLDGQLQLSSGRVPVGRTGYLHRRQQCWELFATGKGRLRSLARSVDKATRRAFVQGLEATAPSAMPR